MGGRALEGCLGTWASWPSFLGRCGFDGARVVVKAGLLQGPLPTLLPPREGQVLLFRPRRSSGSSAPDAKACNGLWAPGGTSVHPTCLLRP